MSDITVQRRELTGVINADGDEEIEVLGRAMMYGIGEVLVPRNWLLDRCDDLGIPESIRPPAPTPHSAYKRAMSRLVTSNPQMAGDRTDRHWVSVSGIEEPLKVELELMDGDGNVKHLTGDVFYPERLTGVEGGKWEHYNLGKFDYDTETQETRTFPDTDLPDALEGLWGDMRDRGIRLHNQMQKLHIGHDLRRMIYTEMILNSPDEWPSIIPLRDAGAVYFVPEGPLTEVLESLSVLFAEINDEWKKGGKDLEIRTLEVVDSADKRDWIRTRVEQTLEKAVDDAVEEAFEALAEGDDTMEEIVEAIAENLGKSSDTAAQYNALLQSKMDVESLLAKKARGVDDDEKEEIIRGAMEELDL